MTKFVLCLIFAFQLFGVFFWCCQVVEIGLFAFPSAVRAWRQGRAAFSVFLMLAGQAVRLALMAVLGTFAILELQAVPELSNVQWKVQSRQAAVAGIAATLLAVVMSARLREELAVGGERRVAHCLGGKLLPRTGRCRANAAAG